MDGMVDMDEEVGTRIWDIDGGWGIQHILMRGSGTNDVRFRNRENTPFINYDLPFLDDLMIQMIICRNELENSNNI